MFSINKNDIFPSKFSFFVFVVYISFFVGQGLLITQSQSPSNIYAYNTVLAVLVTEFVKLILSVIIFCSRYSFWSLFEQIFIHYKLLWLYFIPAFLYCLYNNLAFINLLNYDPATYYILLQLRVVITGLLFQAFFSKLLTFTQWFSLILLTLGCMIKNLNFSSYVGFSDGSRIYSVLQDSQNFTMVKSDGMGFNFNTTLIILQVFCSCIAGVYTEYLLKSRGSNVDVFLQNVFLYFDSIICGVMVLFVQKDDVIFSKMSFDELFQPMVLLVIFNNAIIGIVTSVFLKHLNSILKTVASALELIFITILSWILFSIPIKLNTFLSVTIVLTSIVLYSRNPVQNPPNIMYKKGFAENV